MWALTILDLPDLPMTIIFSYLTVADRLGAELVCWRWNRLAKDKDCWRHFHALRSQTLRELADGRSYSENGLRRLISRFGEFITELELEPNSLSFTFSLGIHRESHYLRLFESIILQIDGQQIRHLKFQMPLPGNFFGNRQLHQLAKKLPELKTLVIEGIMDLELSIQFAMNCPKLEFFDPGEVPPSLELANSGFVFPASVKNIRIKNELLNFTKIAQECPNLVSLEGDFCHLEKNEATDRLFSRLRHFCSHRQFGGHQGNILGQAMVTTQCFENIRALEISSGVYARQFLSIGQKCPQLEHLDTRLWEEPNYTMQPGMENSSCAIIFASKVAEYNFGIFGLIFANLKSLKLRNKDAMQQILPLIQNGNFKQLEWINVSNDYIQNIGHIIALLDNCPNLSHLFADYLTIDVICKIIRSKEDCQLRQLRLCHSIWKQLQQIRRCLVGMYCVLKIPEDQNNPGIVRIFCPNESNTPQSKFGPLHPWLKIFDTDKNPWPIPLPLKQARFDELSEIPSFFGH